VHHIVLEDCIAAVEVATTRRDRLEEHIAAALPDWSLARPSDHETVRFGHPHNKHEFSAGWTAHTSRSSRWPALFTFHPTGTADHGPGNGRGFRGLLLQLS